IVAALAGLALLLARRPGLTALLVVAALPFRIPVQAGGKTSNLLVPLYAVVAAGALAFVARALRPQAWAGRFGETYVGEVDGGEVDGGEVVGGGREGERAAREATPNNHPRHPVVWLERILALVVLLYTIQAVYSPDFETTLQHIVFFYT